MKVISTLGGLIPVPTGAVDVPSMDEFNDLGGRLLNMQHEAKLQHEDIWRRLGDDLERRMIIASRRIALRAANGKFVSVDLRENGNAHLRAEWADQIGDWETFTVDECGDGCIALKAANGKYVRANTIPGSPNPLVARAERIEGWERFRISYQGSAGIALKAHNESFVGADINQRGSLVAWRPGDAQEWEQFRWQAVPFEFSTEEHVAMLIRNKEMKRLFDDSVSEKLRLLDEKLAELRRVLEEAQKLLGSQGKERF